jgi:hypothetical protein
MYRCFKAFLRVLRQRSLEVEQPIRNRQVMGSTPIVGLWFSKKHLQKKNKGAEISMFFYEDATLVPLFEFHREDHDLFLECSFVAKRLLHFGP